MRDDSDGKPTAYSVKRDMKDAAVVILKEHEQLSIIATYPDFLRQVREHATMIFDSTHENPHLFAEPIAEQVSQLALGLQHAMKAIKEGTLEDFKSWKIHEDELAKISSVAVREEELKDISSRAVDAMAKVAVKYGLQFQHPEDAAKYNNQYNLRKTSTTPCGTTLG